MINSLDLRNNVRSRFRLIIWWLLAIACVLPVFYMTIYRYVDETVCYYIVGTRIGVPPTYYGIGGYIHNALKPGMSRTEVHSILSGVGKVVVTEEIPYDSYTLAGVEDVQIKTCSHPLNNFRVILRYDQNWILLSAHIPED
jgi:hypothetical protein